MRSAWGRFDEGVPTSGPHEGELENGRVCHSSAPKTGRLQRLMGAAQQKHIGAIISVRW
jgi:hypothetical protein